MQKTLGGDRLGSGKKMKVHLHGYERSTHDLGYVMRTTMSAGTLVPFLKEIALPGDTFDIDLDIDVKTHPTAGPLFGSYKVQADLFVAPIRLYQGQLHNKKLGIGLKMSQIKLPRIKMYAQGCSDTLSKDTDIDNIQINPSSILSYLGIRGIGMNRIDASDSDRVRYFNAIPLLAYWDIYKNYYSNKQEEIGAVIHLDIPAPPEHVLSVKLDGADIPQNAVVAPVTINNGSLLTIINDGTPVNPADVLLNVDDNTWGNRNYVVSDLFTLVNIAGTTQTYVYNNLLDTPYLNYWVYAGQAQTTQELKVKTFPLENLDEIREEILTATQTGVPFDIDENTIAPFGLLYEKNDLIRSIQSSQEGLAVKTYQSDLLNNWLQTEWIDGVGGITEITAIDTSTGSFTLDTLNLSKKVYNMLNRIAISGGTYDDWKETVYDHVAYTQTETPTYHGGLIKELVFQEVVSNSASNATATQPLGTLAGRGILGNKHKGGKATIRVDEPSVIIGIISLTPRLDYSQGNDWDIHLETMDDLHKPALDEIGFQELITERMAWWDTNWDGTKWVTKSAGKQPAWIEYMTNINRVRGNFAMQDNEMFMTLNRKYTPDLDADVNTVKIKDLTTYIDPRIYNNIFADTSLDSQNFWTQIAVNITARRKMSAKIIPNL